MSITYITTQAHGSGETLSDILDGTYVEKVGPKGIVQVAGVSAKAEDTFEVSIQGTGQSVVPPGSHFNKLAAADSQSINEEDFIFRATGLQAGSKILCKLVIAAASETMVGIRTS